MKEVCKKRGALLILDEVMCGIGRTGTMHAWQQPEVGVAPDIQTIAKALGGGYQPVGGMLVHKDIINNLKYVFSLSFVAPILYPRKKAEYY